jgi:hypothetical protein
MTPYIYMFIREDLSHPQQIIQTAHAVDELSKRLEPSTETNSMVLFPAGSERELKRISDYLDRHGIVHEMFYEPDINGFTAIATEPLKGNRRIVMRRFKTKK